MNNILISEDALWIKLPYSRSICLHTGCTSSNSDEGSRGRQDFMCCRLLLQTPSVGWVYIYSYFSMKLSCFSICSIFPVKVLLLHYAVNSKIQFGSDIITHTNTHTRTHAVTETLQIIDPEQQSADKQDVCMAEFIKWKEVKCLYALWHAHVWAHI